MGRKSESEALQVLFVLQRKNMQLWAVTTIVMFSLMAGLLSVTWHPTWSPADWHGPAYLPQIMAGLVVLMVLLSGYVLDQKRRAATNQPASGICPPATTTSSCSRGKWCRARRMKTWKSRFACCAATTSRKTSRSSRATLPRSANRRLPAWLGFRSDPRPGRSGPPRAECPAMKLSPGICLFAAFNASGSAGRQRRGTGPSRSW